MEKTTQDFIELVELLEQFNQKNIQIICQCEDVENFDQYPSNVQVVHFGKLTISYFESIISLCKQDVIHLFSVLVLSRSVLETAAKTVWMLQKS